jgi:hypothetical protein
VIHLGLDIDGYAEGMAAFAHWPHDRVAVLRRLAISGERWDAAAALFGTALVADSRTGGALVARFRTSYDLAKATLARDNPDLHTLAPLRMATPTPSVPAPAPKNRDSGTAPIDPRAVREVLAGIAPARPPVAQMGTIDIRKQGPFVPSALPFAPATDDDVEAFARLTADLEIFPDRKASVLEKHRVAGDDALAKERARWSAQFEKDARLKTHWEVLHASFVGFAQRQRSRGKEPKP